MNALAIGAIAFVCAFGGALLGMFLRVVLPKQHLSSDSKDVIRVATATLATLAALVIGLLIGSAKNSFDNKDSDLKRAAAYTILLDRTLAEYGPESRDARGILRQIVAVRIHQIWPEESSKNVDVDVITRGLGVDAVQDKLLDLSPQNDAQRWLKSRALELSGDIAETRWLVAQQMGSGIQWPFLAILVFWLGIIFVSFGLFAPSHGTVITVLFVCAVSVAGAIYLIVQMDQPYSGFMKLSSAPLVTAFDQIGRQ
jgi:hypothetical protein